jgi:hypothetical protein
MCEPLQRKALLTAQAIKGLKNAKQQIMAAAAGKVRERLVLATAQAAVRLARREAVPAEVISERALELARETLQQLAQQKWKPDTALLLQKRFGEPQALWQAGLRRHPEA